MLEGNIVLLGIDPVLVWVITDCFSHQYLSLLSQLGLEDRALAIAKSMHKSPLQKPGRLTRMYCTVRSLILRNHFL